GSQFGITFSQTSFHAPPESESVTIANNTITNCGNAPPLFGFTTGIAFSVQGSDHLFANTFSNTMIGCGVSGQGGILGARIGSDGICWRLHDNSSDTGYFLFNVGGM